MSEPFDYSDLIQEFVDQRKSLKEMITDLEKFKENINTILPTNLDKRYLKFFEEKIKTVTELFKAILDIRKEISKSVKDEFEIRRKISSSEDDGDFDGIFDIKKIADRVDKIRKEKILLEQKIESTESSNKIDVKKQQQSLDLNQEN